MGFGPKYRSPEICIFTVSVVNHAAQTETRKFGVERRRQPSHDRVEPTFVKPFTVYVASHVSEVGGDVVCRLCRCRLSLG